ncbi:resistance to inhibitors of cholinesterase protein 3-like [Mizuhopecten yessoensis]|uniref:Resistance to inhibitors of cholinesterase protein 3 n=1 Tax=Mizuhopecten yessoensis TaxID=6573 RepID=A0A210QPQ1_MIZYE|nr:resistance to inhibitors of cholinesterase protein 3-like [Mizuhopecten yessoensis]OWF50713.1 Resistance to inhibitors of cholinesterase protein 3 [Mizuhopecten yessoensis]
MISNDGPVVGGTSNVRMIISVLIIVGCFTVIYPRFFHPVVLKVLGIAPEPSVKRQPEYPPHRNFGDQGPSSKTVPDDMKRHMRPGPHPGMRASAEMNNQKHASGGRGGIMGMVLPMYAVGIVVYLIYTLFKVFNKQGKGDIRRRQQAEQQRRGLAYSGELGSGERNTQPGREPTPLGEFYGESPEEKLANIEDVLNKAEDKHINEKQMQDLQSRLQETEKQMANILKAMNTVSTKVVETTTEGQTNKIREKDNKSSDSSPDISSYEVIDKSKGDKSKSSSPEVDTLTAGEMVKEEEGEKAGGQAEKPEGESEEKKEKDEAEKPEGESEEKKERDEAEIEEVLLEDKKDEEEEEGESSVRKRKTHPVSD